MTVFDTKIDMYNFAANSMLFSLSPWIYHCCGYMQKR